MVTRLHAPLRREIRVGDRPYVVTIADDGLKLVEKGRRKGFELAWRDLLSGDAALAAALHAALRSAPAPRPPAVRRAKPRRAAPRAAARRRATRRRR